MSIMRTWRVGGKRVDSYPKNHRTLDDAGDTRVRRLEELLNGLEIADITFDINDFTVEDAALSTTLADAGSSRPLLLLTIMCRAPC